MTSLGKLSALKSLGNVFMLTMSHQLSTSLNSSVAPERSKSKQRQIEVGANPATPRI